jgi:hypothetical protein
MPPGGALAAGLSSDGTAAMVRVASWSGRIPRCPS